jgi:hypothetical protein
MKRIVNGVTYNTDTATRLATSRWENDDGKVVGTLYQTRAGAFFVDEETTSEVWNESERRTEERIQNAFRPLSPDRAHAWLMDGDVEIFRNPFDDPPEAAAEAEPGATIYIRVPASLKRGVDEAAKEAGVSGNVWAMRCVERCAEGLPKEMSLIWHLACAYAREPEGMNYHPEKVMAAFEEIAVQVESFALRCFGDIEKAEGTGVNDPDVKGMMSVFEAK